MKKKAATKNPISISLSLGPLIFAAQYQLYLPSKEDLKQRLIEWTEEISDDA
jgi:hypothetical protein